MAQTTVQKEESIRFGSGVLKINGVNVGLLDNARLAMAYNVAQIRAHNGHLPAKKKIDTAEFTAELYEINLARLVELDNYGVLTNTSASAVNVTGEALGTGWTKDVPIKLANKNGDDTEVSSIVIDADGTPLVLDTDYAVFVKDGDTYILPITAQTGVLDADYTYTPNAKKTLTFSDVSKLVTYYEAKFVNTDSNGKEFSITFPKGYGAEGLDLGFVSDDAVDEVMKLPIKINAFPDDSNVMLVIDDEQAV